MKKDLLSTFKYKRRIDVEKWFDELYNGKFGKRRCTLSNNEHGDIHIHDTETKEHIASLVRNVLYTNDLSFIQV